MSWSLVIALALAGLGLLFGGIVAEHQAPGTLVMLLLAWGAALLVVAIVASLYMAALST
jgi:hypothetical protein